MTGRLKNAVRRLFWKLGLDLRRANPAEHNDAWLADRGIRSVIDIGANVGQFVCLISRAVPGALVYAFEPLRDCHAELVRNTRRLPNVQPFHLALGDRSGTCDMHRCPYTQSSSLLEMCELHKQAFPHTRGGTTETVPVARLDDVAGDLVLPDNLLVKIDVQGYEDRVIAGGRETIARADAVFVETSFQQLYEGQVMFGAIYGALAELGFAYAGATAQLRSPLDGSVLQADSVFLKPNGAAPATAVPQRSGSARCGDAR